jgi:hypothetical protein
MDACDSPEGDHFTRTRTGTAGTHDCFFTTSPIVEALTFHECLAARPVATQ